MKTLSYVMVLLILGVLMSLSGISSCRKNQAIGSNDSQIQALPLDPVQNLPVSGHVPIPSSLLLLGSGMAGMIFAGWRKRTKS